MDPSGGQLACFGVHLFTPPILIHSTMPGCGQVFGKIQIQISCDVPCVTCMLFGHTSNCPPCVTCMHLVAPTRLCVTPSFMQFSEQ